MVALAAGCADARVFRGPPDPVRSAYAPDGLLGEPAYRVGCADVLAVTFADRPEWDCLAAIDLEGRLPLGDVGNPLVEGGTTEEVRIKVASWAALDVSRVDVRLAEARAGRLYLHGPENNQQRVIPYRGPEPVVEFLWRVGAMKQGCTDLRDVHVLRSNVAVGYPPEVFKVDVEAVLLDGDQRTNVVLQASDQVYVGETRRSSFSRLLPEWVRPMYRKIVGLLPPDGWPWAGDGTSNRNADDAGSKPRG